MTLGIIERDTEAPVTSQMVDDLVRRLGQGEALDEHHAQYAVHHNDLNDAIHLLGQLRSLMQKEEAK